MIDAFARLNRDPSEILLPDDHVLGTLSGQEALRAIYDRRPAVEEAEHLLLRWISWARRSRLPAFKQLGATYKAHLAGIVEHFRSGLSNGFVEAMNSQIQAAKARAKGYATDRNLIAIAYLLCAKLRHLPHNPWLRPA